VKKKSFSLAVTFTSKTGPLRNLLEDQRVPYYVVQRGIGVDREDKYYVALVHLRQHPEVLDAPF
jgi:hypothetical protein